MKKTLITAAIALTGLVALSNGQAQSFTQTNAQLGDLMLGFETTVTNSPGASDLLIDLGPVTNFTSLNSLNFNLSSDLSSVFGTNWASTVSYGLYAVTSSKEIYASAAATNTQGYALESFAAASTQKTDFQNLTVDFNTDGVNGSTTAHGVIESTSETYSWSYFTPYSGAFNNANYANIEVPIGTAITLFAQPTSSSGGNGTATSVQDFTVSTSGQVVPEPSTYALLSLGALLLVVLYRRRVQS